MLNTRGELEEHLFDEERFLHWLPFGMYHKKKEKAFMDINSNNTL